MHCFRWIVNEKLEEGRQASKEAIWPGVGGTEQSCLFLNSPEEGTRGPRWCVSQSQGHHQETTQQVLTGLKMNCQFPSHCPLNFSHFSWWWFNIIFSCSDSSSLSCGYLCVWGFKDGFHVRPKLVGEGEHWEERGEICFFFMMILAMFTWNWLICPGFFMAQKVFKR